MYVSVFAGLVTGTEPCSCGGTVGPSCGGSRRGAQQQASAGGADWSLQRHPPPLACSARPAGNSPAWPACGAGTALLLPPALCLYTEQT